jgi:DNA-binding transcriptional ArsR family regulator
VIQIRMSVADLGRTRFAFSPLAEAAESLYMLASEAIHPLHRSWFDSVRPRLDHVDLALLKAVIPARPVIADFLFSGAVDPTTTIDQQLRLVAELPADQLAQEIEAVWRAESIPPRARELMGQGQDGPRYLAEALWHYWSVTIEPHWRAMRAVLDDDVAYRATELTKGGVGAMLSDLAPQVSLRGEVLRIDKKRGLEGDDDEDLSGIGLLLVPSVFVWPNVVFAVGPAGPPALTYPARGVGNLWHEHSAAADENALGALLGRSRAEIIVALALPQSTTELSLALGQSPSSVSQHLSVLRRCGLVTSWRSGRSVLYRRTDLATSIVHASAAALAVGASTVA